jgi:hypothetical protein
LIVGTLAAIGFLYAFTGAPFLPWSIDAALVAILFMYAGHSFKGILDRALSYSWWVFALGVAGTAVGVVNGYMIAQSSHGADMFVSLYGNPFLYVLGAFCGIYCFLFIMHRAPAFSAITYIGQYSIAFLCLHVFPGYSVISAFIRMLSTRVFRYSLSVNVTPPFAGTRTAFSVLDVLERTILSTVYVVTACLLITVLTILLNRYCPALLGMNSTHRGSSKTVAGVPDNSEAKDKDGLSAAVAARSGVDSI